MTSSSVTSSSDHQSASRAGNPTVANLTLEALKLCEIDTLFCLPGVQNDDFFNHLVDHPSIRPIVTRHEQGAAYMAMGAAQATGKPAACSVVPGPGMLNATAALTSSYWGGARVLALVGAVPTTVAGKMIGVLHDLQDPTSVLRQVTKHAVALDDPAAATSQVQQAVNELVSGPPRPVSIEVPANNWNQTATGTLKPPVVTKVKLDSDAIARAAAVLAQSERPLIIVGSGAYDAGEEIAAIADMLQAPVTTRRMGHGVLHSNHPLFVPITVGHQLWEKADVVIGIGTRMEWPLLDWGTDDDLAVIQINVDDQELDRHGIGTVGIHGDAKEASTALLQELRPLLTKRASRVEEVAKLRGDFEHRICTLQPQRRWLQEIRQVLPDDGILVEDVTQVGFAAHLDFEFRQPRTFLSSGAAGTLGAAVAVGIGAQAAVPDRHVLTIVGDGGFLFTATELATAVQHQIPTTILLFNNNAYGNVKRIQQERFGHDRTIASTLQNPDFVTFAQSFGVEATRLEDGDDLRPALAQAFAHNGPSLIEVRHGDVANPWPFFRLPRTRGA